MADIIEEIMAILNCHKPKLNQRLIESYQQALLKFKNSPQVSYFALDDIVKSKKFKGSRIRRLIMALSFFPIGTYVKLNTDEVGIIIETYPDHPMRGKVNILADAEGEPLECPKVIDLCERTWLYVRKALDDKEISHLNLQRFSEI